VLLETDTEMSWRFHEMSAEMSEIHAKMSAEMSEMRAEMSANMSDMHAEMSPEMSWRFPEMSAEMSEMRAEMSAEMSEMHAEMSAEMSEMHAEMIAGMSPEMAEIFAEMSAEMSKMYGGMNDLQSVIFGSKRLDYYKDVGMWNVIQEWYEMVKSPLDQETSKKQLEKEAKSNRDKPGTRMYKYLEKAKKVYREQKINKLVSGLTYEECLAVIMYTNDGDGRAFYKEYNVASTNRKWKPYKTYTTLLLSALRKLAKPLPRGTHLYRGVRSKLGPPPAGSRIFWKSFTSATLNYDVAKEKFAGPDGIILEFEPPASRYAARVGELSPFNEEEVILLPFEAFDYLGSKGRRYYFTSSETPKCLKY